MRNFVSILFLLTLTFTGISAKGTLKPAPPAMDPPPQSANECFQQGFSAFNSGQYVLAVKCYSEAIERDPNRIYFYYHRGLTYRQLGDKAHAIADFNHCLSMKPIAEAYYELGVYKYDEFDYAAAQKDFETARTLKEDVEKTNFYLGIIYYRFNNFDTAETLMTRYIRLVKTNPDAFMCLAMIKVKMHKYNEVDHLLKLACLYNNNDWQLHLKLYDIYKEMGDKDNMLCHISMVIELGQTKPEYYSIRAALYLEKGEDLMAEYDLLYARNGGVK